MSKSPSSSPHGSIKKRTLASAKDEIDDLEDSDNTPLMNHVSAENFDRDGKYDLMGSNAFNNYENDDG